MTKLKEFKRNKRNKQLLLIALRLMEVLAIVLFAACGLKAFLLALLDYKTLVLIGTGCTLAAGWLASVLENTIEEVKKGGNLRCNSRVGLRRVETDGRRQRGQKIA